MVDPELYVEKITVRFVRSGRLFFCIYSIFSKRIPQSETSKTEAHDRNEINNAHGIPSFP